MVFSSHEKVFVAISIFILSFYISLGLKGISWGFVRIHRLKFLASMLAQILLFPFLTYILIISLSLETSVAIALLLISVCPGGSSSNLLAKLAGGSVEFSVIMTIFSSLFSILSIPFSLYIYFSLLGHAIDLPNIPELAQAIMIPVILVLILPISIGIIVSSRYKNVFGLEKLLGRVIFIPLCGVLVVLFKNVRVDTYSYIHGLLPYVVIHQVGAMIIGYIVMTFVSKSAAFRRASSIEVGYQNTSLAFSFAILSMPSNEVVLSTIALWTIWHNISAIGFVIFIYIIDSRKRMLCPPL